MSALAKNYNRKKIAFKHGKGSYLFSTNGKKYSEVFGDWLLKKVEEGDDELVAITPAMSEGSGMNDFAEKNQNN